ncbi:hypothetical protein OOZ15_03130 [Galbibacter sp. EGI 63066]|uniref:TapB family protein n=1 Tax=Galbibacter sp. EGI 63066 TaxID=2993559 RepID=UPI00224978DC|nr:hypothetical protein [Galbibacter sp. EGI 63066]MCX2678923.1 hypothetical protein [Galbibacter sp. EGI 63066]
MKTLITTFTLLLSLTVMAQSNTLSNSFCGTADLVNKRLSIAKNSQNNCSKYYPFNEGHVSEYEMFNKKGKTDGTMRYTVSNVSNSDRNSTATIVSEIFDKNGESVLSSEFDMNCNGSMVSMNFKSLMNANMMQQFQNGEAEITGTNIELPNSLSEGQILPDANIDIKMNMAGLNMNMTTEISNRKVVGTETITTSAGTFDCMVITQSSSGKMMMVKFDNIQKTWLAKGVGMVKSEDYNARGKLQSSTLLISFSE